jgi:hypothetical protein
MAPAARQVFDGVVGQDEELERGAVDVEPFVIKGHSSSSPETARQGSGNGNGNGNGVDRSASVDERRPDLLSSLRWHAERSRLTDLCASSSVAVKDL